MLHLRSCLPVLTLTTLGALAALAACSDDPAPNNDKTASGGSGGSSSSGGSTSSDGGSGTGDGGSTTSSGGSTTSGGSSAQGGQGGSSMGGGSSGGTTNSGGSGGSVNEGGSGGTTSGSGGTGGSQDPDAGMGGDMDGGMDMDAGDPPIDPDTLDNAGFETGYPDVTPESWMGTGDTDAAYESYAGGAARTGYGRLAHWRASPAYTVSTSQVVSPLPDGTYTFSIWVQRSLTGITDQHLFARGYNAGNPSEEMTISTAAADDSGYTLITLSGIPVDSGQCEVGVYTETTGDGIWANFDDASFFQE